MLKQHRKQAKPRLLQAPARLQLLQSAVEQAQPSLSLARLLSLERSHNSLQLHPHLLPLLMGKGLKTQPRRSGFGLAMHLYSILLTAQGTNYYRAYLLFSTGWGVPLNPTAVLQLVEHSVSKGPDQQLQQHEHPDRLRSVNLVCTVSIPITFAGSPTLSRESSTAADPTAWSLRATAVDTQACILHVSLHSAT